MEQIYADLVDRFLNHPLFAAFKQKQKDKFLAQLQKINKKNHFKQKLKTYQNTLEKINNIEINQAIEIDINSTIHFQFKQNKQINQQIKNIVYDLKPWHKGPFQINDFLIDGQWNCDLKWQRLKKALSNFKVDENQKILDVGSANGYYLYKLNDWINQNSIHPQSNLILGIDHHFLYLMQYYLFFQLTKNNPTFQSIHFLTLSDQQFFKLYPKFDQNKFDLVLSMGVLYHQKNPLAHLELMRNLLKNNAIFILETLIMPENNNAKPELIFPKNKYAKMNNVWFIPNLSLMKLWLERMNFKNIEIVDISQTNNKEQRKTNLSQNWSYEDAVDLKSRKTIEGYDSPLRVLIKSSV